MGFDRQLLRRDHDDWDLEARSERSEAALYRLQGALGTGARRDERRPEEPWEVRVAAAYWAGAPALLDCLADDDPVVRRMAAYVLTYADDDIAAILLRRLEVEDDAASRMALLINLARRSGDEGKLLAFTGPEHSPTDRLGAALGLMLRYQQPADSSVSAVSSVPTGPAVSEQVLDALVLCAGQAGRVLTELAWADLGWTSPQDLIQEKLPPVALQYWLRRMLELPWATDRTLFGRPGSLVVTATYLYRRHPELGIDLVPPITALLETVELGIAATGVPDLLPWFSARPGADGPVQWDRDDPRMVQLLEQVANLYHRSPTLGLLQILVAAADQRALPPLLELVGNPLLKASSEVLESATSFADELTPAITARLRTELDPEQLGLLVKTCPDKRKVISELAETLPSLLRFSESQAVRDPAAIKAIGSFCQELGKAGVATPAVLAALRQVCAGSDLEARQWAVRALMVLDQPAEEIVPILVSLITDHPSRSAKATPNQPAVDHIGWGIDTQACNWLANLGSEARAAEPALRALLAEVSPGRGIRAAGAKAWFRVTGDAETAIRVLVEMIESDYPGTIAENELRSISRVVPVVPTLEALAAEGVAGADRLAASYRSG